MKNLETEKDLEERLKLQGDPMELRRKNVLKFLSRLDTASDVVNFFANCSSTNPVHYVNLSKAESRLSFLNPFEYQVCKNDEVPNSGEYCVITRDKVILKSGGRPPSSPTRGKSGTSSPGEPSEPEDETVYTIEQWEIN